MSDNTITSEKKQKTLWLLYILFLAILSFAFIIMPFASSLEERTSILIYISGGIFWMGLIGTIVMAIIINSHRKKSLSFRKEHSGLKQFGLISFFKNKEAKIADIAMFSTFVGFILAISVIKNIYVIFFCLSLLVCSFGLHCMLNGINYLYIKFKER